jgi:hypothetical protein
MANQPWKWLQTEMPPGPANQAWLFPKRNFRKRSETHYTRLNIWSAINKQKPKPVLLDKRLRLSADRALKYRHGA